MSDNPHYGTLGWGYGGYSNEPIEVLPVGYYKNLLTSEYKNSPKLNQFLQVLLNKITDITTALVKLEAILYIDNATGVWLDYIGQIQNVSRTVPFQPSNGVSPVLDDNTYRLLIKATIAQNNWDGSIDSLYGVWQFLFPGGKILIADQQNMTVEIIIGGTFSSIIQDLITNGMIVPRPEGVLYNYVFGTLPLLGFDLNDSFIAGFDLGHFA